MKPHTRYLILALIGLLILAVLVITGRGRYATLHAGAKVYRLQIASTESEKERGLGARASMPRDEGMIFPYTAAGTQCYWMKGMVFPLDIIWVDSKKEITHIEYNLSPSTYPRSYCNLAQYVIELNAGQANAAHLHMGQALQF